MSAAASWQKQLVYEFKELEGLPDPVLLEDSEGRLQQACSRLVTELAAVDGTPQQRKSLLVLLRLLPLPALIHELLFCASQAPLDVPDELYFSWLSENLCLHSSRICAVLAASTALMWAAVPYSQGLQMCALSGVLAAAAAVYQSYALNTVNNLQGVLCLNLQK